MMKGKLLYQTDRCNGLLMTFPLIVHEDDIMLRNPLLHTLKNMIAGGVDLNMCTTGVAFESSRVSAYHAIDVNTVNDMPPLQRTKELPADPVLAWEQENNPYRHCLTYSMK